MNWNVKENLIAIGDEEKKEKKRGGEFKKKKKWMILNMCNAPASLRST